MHKRKIACTLLLVLIFQVFALAYTTLPYTPLTALELEEYKAYAQAQDIIPVTNIPERIQRGQIHETWNLNNAQKEFRTVLGVPVWTFDSSSGQYVPIRVVDNRSTTNELIIQSGMISVKFLNDDVYFYDANFTKFNNPVSETWLLKNGIVEVPKTFQSLSLIQSGNNANITKSYSTPIGTYVVKYVVREGLPLKHEVTLNTLITGTYSLVQQWSLQADQIKYADSTEDNVKTKPKQVKESTLKENKLKVIEVYNEGKLVILESTEAAFDNFIEMNVTPLDTSTAMEFVYGTWVGSFTLDPDSATLTPSQWARIETTLATGTSCPAAPYSKSTVSGATTFYFLGESDVSEKCHASFFEFDTTSIQDGSDVTDTQLKMDMELVNSPNACDFRPMVQNGSQPSTMSASTAWTEIHDGTPYVSATATCQTAQDNAQWDLGSQADIDVENKLTSNWFAVGAHSTDETNRISTTFRASYTCTITPSCDPDDVQVIITYTPPSVSINIVLNASSGNVAPEGITSFSISGCGTTLTSHDGNPASQSTTVTQNCTLTIAPAVSGGHRWDFKENKASITFNTGTTGGASFTYVYYETFDLTYSDADLPDAIHNATLAYTAPPVSEGSSDSPQSKNVTLTTTPTIYSAKEDQSWTVAQQQIDVSASERYRCYCTMTGTVSSTLTTVFRYQHEFNVPSTSSYLYKTSSGNFTLRTNFTSIFVRMANGTDFSLPTTGWLGQPDSQNNSFLNGTWIGLAVTNTATFTVSSTTPIINTGISVDSGNRNQFAISNANITGIAFSSANQEITFTGTATGEQKFTADQVDTAYQREPSYFKIESTKYTNTHVNWTYSSVARNFNFTGISFSSHSFGLGYIAATLNATIFNEFNSTQPFPTAYRIEVIGPENVTRVDCANCSSFSLALPTQISAVRLFHHPNATNTLTLEENYVRSMINENLTITDVIMNFYMANHTLNTINEYTFSLTDQSGAFPTGNTIVRIKKQSDVGGDLTIDEQRLDVEPKVLEHLVQEQIYKIEVDNGSSVVQVGNFTASTDLDIPMTVNGLLLTNSRQVKHDAIAWDAIHNGTLITISYLDDTASTTSSSLRVFNNTNSSVCTFTSSASTSWQFNCTPVDQFGNYFVQLNVTHPGRTGLNWNFSETMPAHKRGTVLPALNLGLPTEFQTFFGYPVALLGVAFIAMLWAPGKQGFGSIVTGLAAAFFWYAGLFPAAISFSIIALILLVGFMHHFSTRRRIAD